MITLDIISDPVCPWCWIGKARLEAALRERGAPVATRWHPFRLNPDLPPEGVDRQTYMAARFGAARAEAMSEQVAALAAGVGLEMRFDRISRVPNTLDAHRLIRWGRDFGAEDAVVTGLFARYFTDGDDISDPDVLVAIAAAAGLPAADIAARLADGTDVAEVKAAEAGVRGLGVAAVPTYVIDSRYLVEGAQDVPVWTRMLGELEAKASAMEGTAHE